MNTAEHLLAFRHFQFDPATGDLHGPSGPVALTPKALALLGYLVGHPGRLVSKRELLETLWRDVFVTDGVLKVCVRQIRQALGDDARAPRFVETAHRRGYRFIAPVRRIPIMAAHDTRGEDGKAPGDVAGSVPIDLVFAMGLALASRMLLAGSDVHASSAKA